MSTVTHTSDAKHRGQHAAGETPVDRDGRPLPKRWTRAEYYAAAEAGAFRDQRVELIEGQVLMMSPQSPDHTKGVELVRRALESTFGKDYWLRTQSPMRHSDDTEAEPGVLVIEGDPRDIDEHPTSGLLAVEVSKSTVRFDRGEKANLYAAAGNQEYWVVNLVDRQLEVFREPTADSSARFGHRYAKSFVRKAKQTIAPLAKPDGEIRVADLLP